MEVARDTVVVLTVAGLDPIEIRDDGQVTYGCDCDQCSAAELLLALEQVCDELRLAANVTQSRGPGHWEKWGDDDA